MKGKDFVFKEKKEGIEKKNIVVMDKINDFYMNPRKYKQGARKTEEQKNICYINEDEMEHRNSY